MLRRRGFETINSVHKTVSLPGLSYKIRKLISKFFTDTVHYVFSSIIGILCVYLEKVYVWEPHKSLEEE